MKGLGGNILRWLTNFSYFQFIIEHQAGVKMSDADNISRQTNLPTALPSEVEQIIEYEETYKLPYPLDQFQDLIDPTECEQPVSGACGSENCEPGKCCEPCI